MEYVCFLEERGTRREVRLEVRRGVGVVRATSRRADVLLSGRRSRRQIVRWHGPKKVEAFLSDLYHVAKDQDPGSLVTYTNFPTTEYLELPFVDVFTFNVYLHQRRDFCKYLSRLQHWPVSCPSC